MLDVIAFCWVFGISVGSYIYMVQADHNQRNKPKQR